jgi:hypothetical protein
MSMICLNLLFETASCFEPEWILYAMRTVVPRLVPKIVKYDEESKLSSGIDKVVEAISLAVCVE